MTPVSKAERFIGGDISIHLKREEITSLKDVELEILVKDRKGRHDCRLKLFWKENPDGLDMSTIPLEAELQQIQFYLLGINEELIEHLLKKGMYVTRFPRHPAQIIINIYPIYETPDEVRTKI